MLGSGQTLQL